MMPAWQPLSAAGAAACLALAATWAWPDSGAPASSSRSAPIAVGAGLAAAMPRIGDFTQFNINDANPFVPWQLRHGAGMTKVPSQPTDETTPGPTPATPAAPALVLPDAPAATAGPRLVGVLRHGDGVLAHLRLADGRLVALRPGAMADGWTLAALAADGASAELHDRQGRRLYARLGD